MRAAGYLRLRSTGRSTWLAIVLAVVGIVISGLNLNPSEARPQAPAPSEVDARFRTLGRAYLPALGHAYAAAWLEGAKALEAGQPVDLALAAVGRSWDSGRTALFDRMVTPQFHKIVPEGRADAEITPAEKKALASAWRGFARGLDPQSK
jgi:hypothetical protein